MKKVYIILAVLTICFNVVNGQAARDSISMKKVFGGYQFYQGSTQLNMNQLVSAMEPNEDAYKQIKSAQSTNTLATIIGGVGGFMIGWPIGTALGGGEPNWTMAGIGAGLAVVSIPISQKFNKQAKSAVDIYNNGLNTSSLENKNELKLFAVGTGIGLVFKF